ncbi:urease accessory protein UreD [Alcaligenaceae bacterium]|nr:urease accessory protein UreD [Alcaligenaceae bacterium]
MNASTNEWHATLRLSFTRQGPQKTVLSERRHQGPLLVQKALYPEGPEVCHVTILHPPSGIAGGDVLSIDVNVHPGAHALLSTPGATRWYKANRRHSAQNVHLHLAAGACLDWLPQENIFFEQANASNSTHLHLRTGARTIGWEITQLGSICKASHWDEGRILLNTELSLDDKPIWLDAGELCADSPLRTSGNGWAGFPAMATLWAFGPALNTEQTDQLALCLPWNDHIRAGLTHMPQKHDQGLSLIRVLATHVQDIKHLFIALWMRLRPLILNTDGAYLRLWNT